MLDQIEFFVRRLRADAPELFDRDREARADGYPTSSLAGGGGSIGGSRPTEALALARWADARARAGLGQHEDRDHPDNDRLLAGDPVHSAVREVWKATLEARNHLRTADSHMKRALPQSELAANVQRGVPACVSHERFKIYEPQDKGRRGRCRWCYEWSRSNGVLLDPPEHEIRAREERRVYGRGA